MGFARRSIVSTLSIMNSEISCSSFSVNFVSGSLLSATHRSMLFKHPAQLDHLEPWRVDPVLLDFAHHDKTECEARHQAQASWAPILTLFIIESLLTGCFHVSRVEYFQITLLSVDRARVCRDVFIVWNH